jgi:hypothetical protein
MLLLWILLPGLNIQICRTLSCRWVILNRVLLWPMTRIVTDTRRTEGTCYWWKYQHIREKDYRNRNFAEKQFLETG